jgi:hypothetical protein
MYAINGLEEFLNEVRVTDVRSLWLTLKLHYWVKVSSTLLVLFVQSNIASINLTSQVVLSIFGTNNRTFSVVIPK